MQPTNLLLGHTMCVDNMTVLLSSHPERGLTFTWIHIATQSLLAAKLCLCMKQTNFWHAKWIMKMDKKFLCKYILRGLYSCRQYMLCRAWTITLIWYIINAMCCDVIIFLKGPSQQYMLWGAWTITLTWYIINAICCDVMILWKNPVFIIYANNGRHLVLDSILLNSHCGSWWKLQCAILYSTSIFLSKFFSFSWVWPYSGSLKSVSFLTECCS